MSKNNLVSEVNKNSLARPFIDSFKIRFARKFSNEILLNQKIEYPIYRQWAGLQVGLTKEQAQFVLFQLRDAGIFEINSNGFWVRDKKWFEVEA